MQNLPCVKYNLIIRDEADEETIESAIWYEKQRDGLGQEFLEEVENSLNTIFNYPLHYQKISKRFRQIPLKRFPFVILFEVAKNLVIVYSVFHTSRNPKKKFKK